MSPHFESQGKNRGQTPIFPGIFPTKNKKSVSMCGLRNQMDSKYLGYSFDGSEGWIPFTRQRLVKALTVKACFLGNLGHTLFPGQIAKSDNKNSWVIFHKGVVQVFIDFLFGFQVIKRVIRGYSPAVFAGVDYCAGFGGGT